MNLDPVTVKSLKIFMQVYAGGSFSTVARHENVSPSMISRTIYQLEENIGQPLFYRNTRSISPTQAGRILHETAQEMLAQWQTLQNRLQDWDKEPQGLVRINAPVIFAQRHISPYLPQLLARHPKLQLELTQTDDFINPHQDATDLIFRIGILDDSSLRARIFGESRYQLACSPGYLDRHPVSRPEDLAAHDCLLYKGAHGAERWLTGGNDGWRSLDIRAKLYSNNAETLLTAALSGLGIVLKPEWLVSEYLKDGRLVKLLPGHTFTTNPQTTHITAIYPNARHTPLNVRTVIDYFAEVYGNPPYWQIEK